MGFNQREAEELLAATGRRCCICSSLHNVQLHHIVPVEEEGGTDDIDNAIPLCPNCHDEVHRRYASGRTTRAYTANELKLHRQRTIAQQSNLTSNQIHGEGTSDLPSYKSSERAMEDVDRLRRDVEVLEQRLTHEQKLTVLGSIVEAFKRDGRYIFEITPEVEQMWGFDHWLCVNIPKYLVGRGFLTDETSKRSTNVAFRQVRLTEEGYLWYKKQLEETNE